MKKEIIRKHENGVLNLALHYNLAKSLICTILKNKESIKDANVAKGVTVFTKQMSHTIEVEKLLLIWTNEKQLVGDSILEAIMCEKARLVWCIIFLVRFIDFNWFWMLGGSSASHTEHCVIHPCRVDQLSTTKMAKYSGRGIGKTE